MSDFLMTIAHHFSFSMSLCYGSVWLEQSNIPLVLNSAMLFEQRRRYQIQKQEVHRKENENYTQTTRHAIFETGQTKCSTSNKIKIDNKKESYITRKNNTYILQNITTTADILKPPLTCKYCNAKKFSHESQGFCCSNGEISLTINDTPEDLYDLFMCTTDESLEFKKYVRNYNNTFAFTSFGVKYDEKLCRRNKGIYTFRIQGQIYHYINELLPSNNIPSYLQLYFYDTEHEIKNRIQASSKLSSNIITRILNILQVNPYSTFFRLLKDISDLKNHKIHLRSDPGLDQRVYNIPSASQVAAILLDDDPSAEHKTGDIIVHSHFGFKHKVQYYFGCYDPLQYPLLFPHGDTSWHQSISRVNKKRGEAFCGGLHLVDPQEMNLAIELIQKETKVLDMKKRNTVSCCEYYCYKLQIRSTGKSILLHSGHLLQQYVIDMYVKLETQRLDYFRNRQDEIRAELYQGIIDSIECGETRASKIGRRIILPASFIGGPRDMRKRYMDAMSLVQTFGKPDIFLTITCNSNWNEIKQELQPHEEPQNRPDLVTRIFRAKLEELKDELFKKQIFGPIAAYVYVIEFQKRGLPHAHFLTILKPNSKIIAPEDFDRIVSSELPNINKNIHLHSTVVKHMIHGPCGDMNPANVCMKKNGKCKNHYPKAYSPETYIGNNSYPKYKRQNYGQKVKVRGHYLDNRWVIPYNPYLLAKFDCHMNVEICSTVKAVKYLYKYIYKGHDRIAFHINTDNDTNNVDEIENFQSARWISPPEAMWRIYGFTLNEMHLSVITLQLHLEDKQLITFRKSENVEKVINNNFSSRSMLTEYFHMNKTDKKARCLLYKQFPEHFVWSKRDKLWFPRKKHYAIGRVVTANPTEGERYYLRLLLNHIRGITSFEDLKIVNGVLTSSFRESALLHGLLKGDNNLTLCLQEASIYQMPYT
ncbi:hypothetical protein UlMin_021663 [Ulmus minor]